MRSLLRVLLGVMVSASWLAMTVRAEPPAEVEPIAGESLLRQALEAELAGDKSASRTLFQQATAASPEYAPARWYSGQLRDADEWLTIAEAQKQAAGDQRLVEYRQLRNSADNSVAAHLTLARWCRRHRMSDHERFHWTSVLNLQPGNEEAIAGLKLKKWRGMLLTLGEIEDFKEMLAESKAAFDKWSAWLTEVQKDLASDSARQEAEAMARLKRLKDLAALPALAASLQKGDEHFCLAAIDTLSAMREQQATDVLVWQAVVSEHAKVRQAAAEALKPRPLHSFVPVLVGSLTSPLELSPYVASFGGGHLAHGYTIERDTPFAEFAWSRSHNSDISRNANRNGKWGTYNRYATSLARQSRYAVESQAKAIQQVASANRITEAENQRLFAVLDIATGQKLEHVPQVWWRWWQDFNELEIPEHKPRYARHRATQHGELHGDPTAPLPRRSASCFIAGTPVWTETGLEPIEKLRAGDRVLSQDPQTGELTWKFVVETTIRPASPTFRVQTGVESLVATHGHPFWVAGKGWRMAKELQSNDRLYSVEGVIPIAELAEGPDCEAHNLVVDDFGTYFVGKTGLLVRDNTLRELPTTPLPGFQIVKSSQP